MQHDENDGKLYNIYMGKGQYLKAMQVPKYDFGIFQAIGGVNNVYNTTKKPVSTDIFTRISRMSKSAILLFEELKNNRYPENNLCTYALDNPTRSQQVMFNKYIAEMKKQDIIVKAITLNALKPVPKNTYMFNPHLIKCYEQQEAELTWKILTEGKVQLPTSSIKFLEKSEIIR